jgi:phosphate/sulfate permease
METVQASLWVVVVLVAMAVVFDFMKTVLFIFVLPLLGFLPVSLMMVIVSWTFRGFRPLKVDKWFRRLQLVSAGNIIWAWVLTIPASALVAAGAYRVSLALF